MPRTWTGDGRFLSVGASFGWCPAVKILMVSPSCPVPADTGGRQRIYHCLRTVGLTDEVTLCTLVETDRQWASLGDLSSLGIQTVGVRHKRGRMAAGLRGLVTGEPLHVARYRSRTMRAEVSRLLRQGSYDAVWCHFLHGITSLPPVGIPVVLDLQNLDDLVWSKIATDARNPLLRAYARLNTRQWARFQRERFGQFSAILAPSPEEAGEVESLVRRTVPVWLAPNGVTERPVAAHRGGEGAPRVLFCASMHIRMNEDAAIWLLREIWPLVLRVVPEAELWLVGGRPSPRVRRMANLPGVHVTGWVSELEEFYERAAVAVVPLRFGGGTKLKTLEAMNLGVPVVATPTGVQGIDARSGEHLLVAGDAEGFAAAVEKCLRDPQGAHEMAARARELVSNRYRWRQVYGPIRDRLEALVAKRKSMANTQTPETL